MMVCVGGGGGLDVGGQLRIKGGGGVGGEPQFF